MAPEHSLLQQTEVRRCIPWSQSCLFSTQKARSCFSGFGENFFGAEWYAKDSYCSPMNRRSDWTEYGKPAGVKNLTKAFMILGALILLSSTASGKK